MLVAGCTLPAHFANSSRGRGRGKVEANALRALRLFSANYWHIPSRTALSVRAILSPPPPVSRLPCCFPSVDPLNKCRSISLSVSARGQRDNRRRKFQTFYDNDKKWTIQVETKGVKAGGGGSGAGKTAKALLSRKMPAHFLLNNFDWAMRPAMFLLLLFQHKLNTEILLKVRKSQRRERGVRGEGGWWGSCEQCTGNSDDGNKKRKRQRGQHCRQQCRKEMLSLLGNSQWEQYEEWQQQHQQ